MAEDTEPADRPTDPKDEPTDQPAPSAPKKESALSKILKPTPKKEPKPAKEKVGPDKPAKLPDLRDGMSDVVTWAGDLIPDKGVGRAVKMTAPTSGRLLADGIKRFPGLHAFLGIFFGGKTREGLAVLGLPAIVGRMERHPEEIPSLLPKAKALMRPILKDMLKAAREEALIMEDLSNLERELSKYRGGSFTVDHLILCELLGFSQEEAEMVLADDVASAVANYQARHPIPPELLEEPEPEGAEA